MQQSAGWEAFLVDAGLISQLVLAGVGLWYTIETRLQRLQMLEEMKILRHQTRVTIAPSLVPGIESFEKTKADLKQAIRKDKDLTDEERAKQLQAMETADIKYVCGVTNPSDRV